MKTLKVAAALSVIAAPVFADGHAATGGAAATSGRACPARLRTSFVTVTGEGWGVREEHSRCGLTRRSISTELPRSPHN